MKYFVWRGGHVGGVCCDQMAHRVLNLVLGPVSGVASLEVYVMVGGLRSNSLFMTVIPPVLTSVSNSSCAAVRVA